VIKLPKTRACTKTKMFFISPQVVNILLCAMYGVLARTVEFKESYEFADLDLLRK